MIGQLLAELLLSPSPPSGLDEEKVAYSVHSHWTGCDFDNADDGRELPEDFIDSKIPSLSALRSSSGDKKLSLSCWWLLEMIKSTMIFGY